MALMRARTAEVLPESYAALGVRPLNGLMERLGEVLRAASKKPDPTLAILSTGPTTSTILTTESSPKSSARSWQSGTR